MVGSLSWSGADVDRGSGRRLASRQRTLFSWAEFMAGEPDEPPKRQRRHEAPTLSLFEWALERERDRELVSALH